MCAPISQALLTNSCMPSLFIYRVSFYDDKMTNQVKLNHFDNSKTFFCESLNAWGASVIVGTIVESIKSLEPCTMACNQ